MIETPAANRMTYRTHSGIPEGPYVTEERPSTHINPSSGMTAAANLVADLRQLVASCPGEVKAAKQARQTADAETNRTYETAIAAATERFLAKSRATEQTASSKRKTLIRDHDALVQRAQRAREKAVRQFAQETQELADRAAKELEEGEWLSDTLVEAGDRKADLEIGSLRTMLSARQKQLDEARERTGQVLLAAGFQPLPKSATPDEPPTDPDAAYKEASSRIERTRVLADSPTGSRMLVVIATAAITLGVAAWMALQKRPGIDIATWAGASAVASFALLFLVQRFGFRSRVPRAALKAAAAIEVFDRSAAARLSDVEKSTDESKRKLREKRDREIVKLRAAFDAITATVERRNAIDGPTLQEVHDRIVATTEHVRKSTLEAHDAETAEKLGVLREDRERAGTEATQTRNTALANSSQAFDAVMRSIHDRWNTFRASWSQTSANLAENASKAAPPWNSLLSNGLRSAEEVPTFVPIGSLQVDPIAMARTEGAGEEAAYAEFVPGTAALPVALELAGRASLFVRHSAARRADAMRLLNQVMLRLITAVPPAKARFTIIDPIGLGQGFSSFMHLADADPLLVTDKIWTEPRHIEQKLGDLTEHMENVIQKYLRNQYSSIAEYNEAAGEVAEPLRFLVIADWPANLTDLASSRLASIVSAGAKCGVFTLIATDLAAKATSQLSLADLQRSSLSIILADAPSLDLEPFKNLQLTLDEPPAEELVTELLAAVGTAAKELGRVQVPFDTVAPTADREWTGDSSLELSIPIGRAGARKLQRLTLGRGTAQHALIAGRTGSGKSTLFHVIITNLAMWYSPREVELYLIDFKKGVEFKAYASRSLPHARVIAVESEREFGLSVLRRLDAELTRRGVLFRDAGAQDVAAYRSAAAKSGGRLPAEMPRIVLAVDEFQEFFVDDDRIAQDSALLLDRLVRQGRAFGIHLILGSQTLGGAFSIARSTIGQMGVRIALQSSEQDSYLIMSEDNTAPRLLTRPGEAIYNDTSGLVEGNSPFQVVWLPDQRRDTALEHVSELSQQHAIHPPAPIVFEGNLPADVRNNPALAALLTGTRISPVPVAWLGDAISIKDPTQVTFHRRGGANALFVGTDEPGMSAMFATALVTLVAQTDSSDLARFTLVNGMAAEGESGVVVDSAAHAANSTGEVRVSRHGPREAVAAVASVAAEVERRMAMSPEAVEASPARFLVLYGVQRIRDLRRSEEFSFSASDTVSAADQLAMILREGPNVGVHVLLWCDTVNAIERVINRQSMREFGWRIVTQMSGNDSTHIIDTPGASSLGRNRALLFSDETAGLEKFRPYSPPSTGWLRHASMGTKSDRADQGDGVSHESAPT